MTGTCSWFDAKKGYGFIKTSDDKDVFVHFTDIQGDGYRKLDEGQSVEFDTAQGKKGLKAVNVKPITMEV